MKKLVAPFILVFALGIAGCVSTPQTPRQWLASAELTYQSALHSINDLTAQGVIEPGSEKARQAADAIKATRAALDVWQTNPDSKDKMSAGLTALQALQVLINQYQPEGGAS